MGSTGRIRIIYHPVLKEMRFERHENGRWVKAGDARSVLNKYVTRKDLLLQNLGCQFFKDIADSMDGVTNIVLDFEGTREDYEDLKEMAAYYQPRDPDAQRRICVGGLTELPPVRELFDEVMRYSNETSDTFRQMVLDPNAEKTGAEVYSIRAQLEKWLEELHRTREGLKENAVNLCFVGAYSSGKSTLINTLIGESILPEALQSETAKMFKIAQLPEGSEETPGIWFDLIENGSQHQVTLRWDEEKGMILAGWPQENAIRQAVQCVVNQNAGKRRHLQIKEVLRCINRQPYAPVSMDKDGNLREHDTYIRGVVNVRYPFDLRSDMLFSIYDTPGTDSNNPAHLETLKAALEDPASSILVFVTEVKLEGKGNAVLLDILSDMEAKRSAAGSTIDLGRSFFVVNWADNVKEAADLENIQKDRLILRRAEEEAPFAGEGDGTVEIRLWEKRLFFTDALHAGDAKAVLKGIAGDAERERLRDNEKLVKRDWLHLYRYDKMAQAETETNRLIETADEKLARLPRPEEIKKQRQKEWQARYKQAILDGTEDAFLEKHPAPETGTGEIPPEAFYICCGVSSLQEEIERYAERFALAVRTKGIIDGTRALIRRLNGRCEEVRNDLQKDIELLDVQIRVATGRLNTEIENICRADRQMPLSDAEAKAMGLTRESTQKKKNDLEEKLHEKVGSIQLFDSKRLKKSMNNAKETAQKELKKFFEDYSNSYTNRMEKLQMDLIRKIERAIDAQKELDEDTRQRLKQIPKKNFFQHPEQIAEIRNREYLDRILFINYVKKEEFIDALMNEFDTALQAAAEQYKISYQKARSELADEIQKKYQGRIGEVAGQIMQLKEDRAGTERELHEVEQLLADVTRRDRRLEDKIYGRRQEQEDAG